MNPTGAVFQPELIELMKAVLDDATAMLPEAKRTSAIKAEIASHILAYAAKGERDPVALKMVALFWPSWTVRTIRPISRRSAGQCEPHGTLAMDQRNDQRTEELNSLRLALATFALRLDPFEARL